MEVNKDKEIEERNRLIDYIFDNDLVEKYAHKISLEDAIRYIQMNLKRDKKDIHPMIAQSVKEELELKQSL